MPTWTTPGTYTWVVPSGITKVADIEAIRTGGTEELDPATGTLAAALSPPSTRRRSDA